MTRPSRKSTPCSYCLTTRMASDSTSNASTTTTMTIHTNGMGLPFQGRRADSAMSTATRLVVYGGLGTARPLCIGWSAASFASYGLRSGRRSSVVGRRSSVDAGAVAAAANGR